MSEISKSERRGLMQMQSSTPQHPDADLLTAFAEQALTTREREQVMSHLAVRSTCRDVLALAAPESAVEVPPVEVPVAGPVRRLPWWNLPALRWAAVAATAAVIITGVGVNNYMRHQSLQNMASAKQSQYANTLPAQSAT